LTDPTTPVSTIAQPYEAMAEEDKKRYAEELAAYSSH